jgi:hypothetical protein
LMTLDDSVKTFRITYQKFATARSGFPQRFICSWTIPVKAGAPRPRSRLYSERLLNIIVCDISEIGKCTKKHLLPRKSTDAWPVPWTCCVQKIENSISHMRVAERGLIHTAHRI